MPRMPKSRWPLGKLPGPEPLAPPGAGPAGRDSQVTFITLSLRLITSRSIRAWRRAFAAHPFVLPKETVRCAPSLRRATAV
jgi:hypothetical protein